MKLKHSRLMSVTKFVLFLTMICIILNCSALAQQGGITTGGGSERPIYVSGVVLLENGDPPPKKVKLELVCQAQTQTQGNTDVKGAFHLQLGLNRFQGASDASASSGGMNEGFGGGLRRDSSDTQATQIDGASVTTLVGCSLRGVLDGYRSDMADLSRIHVGDTTDLGTIYLHPIENSREAPPSSGAVPKNARKALEKARDKIALQKAADAEKELQKAIQIYPKYAEAWQELGSLLQAQRKMADARKAYLEAVACDAQYAKPFIGLAYLSAVEQNWQETLQNSEMYLKLDPAGSPQAYYYGAVAQYNLTNLDKALEAAQKAVSLDRGHTVPLAEQLLGVIYLAKDDAKSAVEQFRNYLAHVPPNTDVSGVKAVLAEAEKQLAESGAK